jgi:SHS2 domain-containing protein
MEENKLEYEALPQRKPRRRKKMKKKNEENANDGDENGNEEQKNKRAKTNGKPPPKVVVMMLNTTSTEDGDGENGNERTTQGANATTTTTTTSFLSTKPVVSYDTTATNKNQYEYKDHTADIQIRSWGDSTATAFAWSALGMFDYMTPLHKISETPNVYRKFSCSAHDLKSLLFAFLDELLFVFHTESLVCTKIQISEFRENKDESLENEENRWTIEGIVAGDLFVDGVHEQGTEVKAITYSEMQIHVADDGSTEVYVIVDI